MSQSLKIVLISLVVAIVSSTATALYFILQRQNAQQSTDQQSTSEQGLDQKDSQSTNNQISVDQKDTQKQDRSQEMNGPYYHQVYSATSHDGLTWKKQDQLLFDHASVPGAVIKDGIIYLYFVDASGDTDGLSVGISKDLGKTFERKSVVIKSVTSRDSVDPHPELLGDGTIRLYFLGDFSQLPEMEKKGKKITIYSAISTDGVNFDEAKTAYQDDTIMTDPDVFKTDKDWRLFASKGKGLDLAISTDGGLTFKKDTGLAWSQGGVSDTFNYNGTYRTYVCGQGIQSATGGDTGKLTLESGMRLEEQGKITCDPSVIQLPDKTYLMFYKTQEMNQQNQIPAGQGSNNQVPNQPNSNLGPPPGSQNQLQPK